MPDQRNEIEDELVALRKGQGLTADRLLRASELVDVLGGRDQPPETLVARLVSAIDSLEDLDDKEALRAAFGLHPITRGVPTLQGRRQAYAPLVRRSTDTLRDWEDRALVALSLRLLTNYYAGAPIDRTLPMPHGGLLLSHLAVRTTYRDRRFIMHEQWRRIIPLVDGAAAFQYNSTNAETELEPLEGIRIESEHVNGGSIHRLYFLPGPLAVGKPHRFGFVERRRTPSYDTTAAHTDKAGQSFETPTLQYRQDVQFEGERPPVLWRYTNLSLLERPGKPSPVNVVLLDEGGRAHGGFRQLYGGLHSGIAWSWSP